MQPLLLSAITLSHMLSQIDKVSPSFLHQAVLLVIGVLGGAAAFASVYGVVTKRKRQVEFEPPLPKPPFEVRSTPEHVTAQACQDRHATLLGRIDGHDEEFKDLRQQLHEDTKASEQTARVRSAGIYVKIEEVRKELKGDIDSLRKEVGKGFSDIDRAIGRIEGKLEK